MTKHSVEEFAPWIERCEYSTGLTLTEGQKRLVAVVRSLAPFYRLPTFDPLDETTGTWQFDKHGQLVIDIAGELATADGGELTRLVIAAHQHCVRVALYPKIVWRRDREAECHGCSCPDVDGWPGESCLANEECDCDCKELLEYPVMQMRLSARDPESSSIMSGHPTATHLAANTERLQFGP